MTVYALVTNVVHAEIAQRALDDDCAEVVPVERLAEGVSVRLRKAVR